MICFDDIVFVFIDYKWFVFLGIVGYEIVWEEIDEKLVNVEKVFRYYYYEWLIDGDLFKG